MQQGYTTNFSDVITVDVTKMGEKIEPLVAIETKNQNHKRSEGFNTTARGGKSTLEILKMSEKSRKPRKVQCWTQNRGKSADAGFK